MLYFIIKKVFRLYIILFYFKKQFLSQDNQKVSNYQEFL